MKMTQAVTMMTGLLFLGTTVAAAQAPKSAGRNEIAR